MRYRAPEELFDLVAINAPFEDGDSAMQIYTQMFTEFLNSNTYEIGDEIEFPDLNGNTVVLIKEFPSRNN